MFDHQTSQFTAILGSPDELAGTPDPQTAASLAAATTPAAPAIDTNKTA